MLTIARCVVAVLFGAALSLAGVNALTLRGAAVYTILFVWLCIDCADTIHRVREARLRGFVDGLKVGARAARK